MGPDELMANQADNHATVAAAVVADAPEPEMCRVDGRGADRVRVTQNCRLGALHIA